MKVNDLEILYGIECYSDKSRLGSWTYDYYLLALLRLTKRWKGKERNAMAIVVGSAYE